MIAALVAAPGIELLTSCDERPASLRPMSVDDDLTELQRMLGRPAIDMLSYAALAPSGHNTQPWNVDVLAPDHWQIGANKQRLLPAVDPSNRETLLSIGAFLENLILVAQTLGFAIDYKVVAADSTDNPLLDLTLRKSTVVTYPLARLRSRRTIRRAYGSNPLTGADVAAVTGGDSSFHYFPRNTKVSRYLVEETISANRKQAFREQAQQELADWIRWNRKDQRLFRNGLTPASMEITGLAGWYVGAFYDRRSVLDKSFRERGIDQVVERVKQGAGWLVQTGEMTVTGLIETGRCFERMWLKLRERGIAIHPMTQLLEESTDIPGVAKSLGVDAIPQFLLRIGYVTSYPDPVSPRMSVASFTRLANLDVANRPPP